MRSNSNLAVNLQAPTPEQSKNVVLQALVITAQVLTGSVGVCLALFTYGKLLCQASAGVGWPLGTSLDAATGVVGTCVQTRSPAACPDIELQEALDRDRYRALDIRSLLIVPILWPGGDLAGVLEAFYHEPNGFSADEDLQCLSVVSAAITGVICGENVASKGSVGEITQPSLAFPNPTGMHGLGAGQDPRVVWVQRILSHLSSSTAWEDIRPQIVAACEAAARSTPPPDQRQPIPTTRSPMPGGQRSAAGPELERQLTVDSGGKKQDQHDKTSAQENDAPPTSTSYGPSAARTQPRPWSTNRLTLVVVLLATVVLELAGLWLACTTAFCSFEGAKTICFGRIEVPTSTVSKKQSNVYNPLAALLFRFRSPQKQPQKGLFLVTNW